MSYSNAAVEARLEALLDPGTRADLEASAKPTALHTCRGLVGGRAVWLAANDTRRARGAIGVAEARQLQDLLQAARRTPAPIFLLLDSAGAKVDEGLAALGAFRRLYREALLTRLAGVPMFALLGRACFGGSSMLAMLCNLRVYTERTLLAATGPAVIQALAGASQLNASDPAAVRELMGGAARVRVGTDERLLADDLGTFRDCARDLVSSYIPGALNLHAHHEGLRQRLGTAASMIERQDGSGVDRMRQLVPAGYLCSMRDNVVLAMAMEPRTQPVFIGFLGGNSIGALANWILADEVLAVHDAAPASAIILLLAASGHAATRRDEELILSEYIVHFALSAAWAAAHSHRVELWIPGEAAGAMYVAFAAPAERVYALPTAQLRILPQAAVTQILRSAQSDTSDPDTWLRTGVADALLDPPLPSYATARQPQ